MMLDDFRQGRKEVCPRDSLQHFRKDLGELVGPWSVPQPVPAQSVVWRWEPKAAAMWSQNMKRRYSVVPLECVAVLV